MRTRRFVAVVFLGLGLVGLTGTPDGYAQVAPPPKEASGSITLSKVGTPPLARKVQANYSWSDCTGAYTSEYTLFKGTVANKGAAVPVGGNSYFPVAVSGSNEHLITGTGGALSFGTGDTVFGRIRILNAAGNVILEKFSTDLTVP